MNDLMTAAQFRRYGGPEVLEIVSSPRPVPAPHQVMVSVQASAVNPHDAVVRSGGLKLMTGRKFPLGLGLDFAGTVTAVGSEVSQIPVGRHVWGMVSPKTGHVTGAAAQYVAVPADRVGVMPQHLSMIEAASLVTSGTTALRALVGIADVRPGQRVLIRGGAGGVGMTAVQLANALGAHVTALVNARDFDFAAQLGAHEVLDYRLIRPQQLEPFAAIVDTAGTELLAYRRRLAHPGRMVTIAFGSGAAMATIAVSTIFGSRRVRSFSSYPDCGLLDELARRVDAGQIWPVIDEVYPLERIGEAHHALATSGRHGKLVLATTQASQPPDSEVRS